MKRKKNRSLCSTYLPSIIMSASTLLLSLSTPPLPRFRRPFFIRVPPRFLRFPSLAYHCSIHVLLPSAQLAYMYVAWTGTFDICAQVLARLLSQQA